MSKSSIALTTTGTERRVTFSLSDLFDELAWAPVCVPVVPPLVVALDCEADGLVLKTLTYEMSK